MACLCAVLYAVSVASFHDVYLTTFGPSHLTVVVAHHPICWPYAIGGLRELNACLYDAVLEISLVACVDASRGELLVVVVLTTSCQHEVTIVYSDILFAIVLQLLVAATVAVLFNIPQSRVETCAVKLVAPSQLIG